MTDAQAALAPCPFCGSSAPCPPMPSAGHTSQWCIECINCHAETYGETACAAIAAWNRRATTAERARIAELEAALRFYRDQWQTNGDGDPTTPGLSRTWQEPTMALFEDEGRNARNALTGSAKPEAIVAESGIAEIVEERRRHREVEGWTDAHDDEHTGGELARAAACYAMGFHVVRWPWSPEWWKPKDRLRDLARAGALIAAEIARLKRAALQGGREA